MEKDDEMKGAGNSYDFGARMLDPRLGRWFACDLLEKKYPSLSCYNFARNTPIIAIDPDVKWIILCNPAADASMFSSLNNLGLEQ